MKKILLVLTVGVLIVACGGKKTNAEEAVEADSVGSLKDSTVVETTDDSRVSKTLPVTKEEALRAWKELSDYIEGGNPDRFLAYDIDGDGQHELILANSRVKDGDARAVFTVENGKLKCLANTVYPTPGAAQFSCYVGDGYLLWIVENHGKEFTSYILKNSKQDRMAYKSMLIVGWDEEKEEPIYEFGEEGQPMIGKDFDSLEPSDEATKYLDTKDLTEVNAMEGWQEL